MVSPDPQLRAGRGGSEVTRIRNRNKTAAAHVGQAGTIAGSMGGAEADMTIGTILLIILVILLIGAVPSWPYSRGWGYWPGGIIGIVLIVVLILLLMGRI
jgi:hypothetical protein